MSNQWPAVAYSASNRVVFPGQVARTRQPEFCNSITTFRHNPIPAHPFRPVSGLPKDPIASDSDGQHH